MTTKEICKFIVDYYGKYKQKDIAVEECAELIQAIIKTKRYPYNKEVMQNLIEEIADVLIVIEELKIINNISDEAIEDMIKYKLDRQLKRIREDEQNDSTV